jgi:Zn-dependent peptidase ImmA (M78 family)
VEDYSKIKCKFLKKEEIRNKADYFRKIYWKSDSVPVDMESVIEHGLHLDIIPVHGVRQLDNIDAYLKSDLTGIVVDITQYMDPLNRYENRLRFSFAHEVGHFILHDYIYKSYNVESPQEYYDFVMNFPESEYKSFEWQANEFAGSLLVPRDRLLEEIEHCKEMLKERELLYLWDENREQALVSMSPLLGRVFGVSDDVIERRINADRDLWI